MNKIKIVKKEDAPALKVKKRKLARQRDTAREMVATVSDWVADLKERKSAETKAAIELISGRNGWPNEG
jgi:hypothetical protein